MKYSKSKFLLIISVVVLISYLVYFLVGLAYGLAVANKSAIEMWDADGIVMTQSANKNINGSNIEIDVADQVKAEDKAYVNISRGAIYLDEKHDEESMVNVAFLGIEESSFIRPQILDGSWPSKENEVAISKELAEVNGLKIGDVFQVAQNKRNLEVSGITESAQYSTSPVVYTWISTSSSAMMLFTPKDSQPDAVTYATEKMPKRINGIVIKGSDYSSGEKLDNDLEYYSISDYIWALPGYKPQVLTFGMMIGFLILISAIIIGIFMYILTVQKRALFGIMKAQGIPFSMISGSVLWQTVLIVVLGMAIGLALSLITSGALGSRIPYENHWPFLGVISFTMLISSVLGTIFSVVGIAKVDPLEAIE